VTVNRPDSQVLRELVAQLADIAALPVHQEKAELWRRLNDLASVRPMVWINEIPWHEMNVDDELTLRCENEWCRRQEQSLRRELYQWRHMPADMVVSDYLRCPLAVRSTGFGLGFDEDTVGTDPTSDVLSHRYHPQIVEPADVEKIRTPVVTHDAQASRENLERMQEFCSGLMPVRQTGRRGIGVWPWDLLVRWIGVTETMVMLIDRPGMAHAAMERLSNAYMEELRQIEELNVLSLNADNTRVGSGGYGYAGDLPPPDCDPAHVRPEDMWGSTADQMFGDVSPEMHWEFGIRYELRWLSRCGLTYYGCCEPLDRKMDVLRRIPNLRKVSMSPWTVPERAAAAVGTDYVYSWKPNPAIVAEDRWRPERAREDIRRTLEATRGCHVEIIMKDISTVRYEPRRLWEWESIAMECAHHFAA
jgi:hypothetical protein